MLLTFYTDGMIRAIPDFTPVERDAVDEMNTEFASEFSEAAGRILERNNLAKKYGRQVVDTYDWLALVIAAFSYHRDMAPLRKRHAYAVAQRKNQPRGAHPLMPPPPQGGPQNVVNQTPTSQESGNEPDGGTLPFDGIAVPPGSALD